MTTDPAAMLRILFAIPPDQIERDIANGESDFKQLLRDLQSLRAGEREQAEFEAAYYHKEMVLAKVIQSRPELSEGAKIWSALSARWLAQEAVMAASEKGHLAELDQTITEIEKREGLKGAEYFPLGKGPADYQKLAEEWGDLSSKIEDVVFTTVLRRYGLNELADIAESDPAEFAALSEKAQLWFEGK